MEQEVVLTGLRSNAQLHLGNYLGAMKPMVELQRRIADDHKYQLHMFVPDLHSFTTPVDHADLFQNSLDNIRSFVAAGLDLAHERTCVYRQSYISSHSEMAWILSCFTRFGELKRMTQFKDKSQSADGSEDGVSAALFTYPVLMAADILLYDAVWVPVGEDQRQHLELARDIAERINRKFDDQILVLPHEWSKQLEFAHRQEGVRIRSLRRPEQKMSKSIEDPAGTILLNEPAESAVKKIMSATTDSIGTINFDWKNQPGIANLLQILALATDETLDSLTAKWQGRTNYGELKTAVAEAVSQLLNDFQNAYAAVDQAALIDTLARDEAAVAEKAHNTLERLQRAVGLRPKQ